MKRLKIICVLAVITAALLFVCGAEAETYSGTCGTGVTWTLEDGLLKISGSGAMDDSYAPPWDAYKESIEEIVIQDGVTAVGAYNFQYYYNVTSVYIADSVRSIGWGAFSGLSQLESIVIPEGVRTIDKNAFDWCGALSYVELPESLTSIGAYAFSNCSSLTTIDIPESVSSIGEEAFASCSSLENATIRNGSAEIGANAFAYCNKVKLFGRIGSTAETYATENDIEFGSYIMGEGQCGAKVTWSMDSFGNLTLSGSGKMEDDYTGRAPWYIYRSELTNVVIGEGITSISGNSFANCTFIANVDIADTVKIIGVSAFEACTSLTAVELPAELTEIADGAFYGCTQIESIAIPSKVETIGEKAFYRCVALKTVTLKEGLKTIEAEAFAYCSALTDITLPFGLDSIGKAAFENCTSLKQMIIPADTDTGECVFSGCQGLETVKYLGATDVSNSMFEGCTSLTSVTLHEGIEKIGNEAFTGCSALVEIVIPESVTSISPKAFRNCYALEYFGWPEKTTVICANVFENCTSLKRFDVPDTVITISNNAFAGCTGLTCVTIPDSVTSIGDNVFKSVSADRVCYLGGTASETLSNKGYTYNPYGYTDLYVLGTTVKDCKTTATAIEIPSGLTVIGASAFADCDQLTSLTIPEGVTSIEANAFDGCSLTEIALPESLTNVNSAAFENCAAARVCAFEGQAAKALESAGYTYKLNSNMVYSLKGTEIADCDTDVVSVNVIYGITAIGDNAFEDCASLLKIELPETVEKIGDKAFKNCTSLADVVFSSTLSEIGEYAFTGCSALTRLELPESLETVDWTSFGGCSADRICVFNGKAAQTLSAKQIYYKIDGYEELSFYGTTVATCSDVAADVVIPEGTTAISSYAFNYTNKITSVTIPDSVTSVNSCSFYNCYPVKYCTLGGAAATALTKAGYAYKVKGYPDLTFSGTAVQNCENTAVEVVVPEGVTELGRASFLGCSAMTRIELPTTLTTVATNAFSGCSALTELILPDGVTSLEYYTLHGCNALKRIYIPDSVVTFKDQGMSKKPTVYCHNGSDAAQWAAEKKMSIVYVSDMVTSSGETVHLPALIELAEGTSDFFPFSLDGYTWTSSDTSVAAVDAYGNVTAVAPGIAEITAVSEDGTTVGKCTVITGNYRDTLSKLTLPAATVTVSEEAFANIAAWYVVLPDGCTTIEGKAFADCESLCFISIPASVTSIADDVFGGAAPIVITAQGSCAEAYAKAHGMLCIIE